MNYRVHIEGSNGRTVDVSQWELHELIADNKVRITSDVPRAELLQIVADLEQDLPQPTDERPKGGPVPAVFTQSEATRGHHESDAEVAARTQPTRHTGNERTYPAEPTRADGRPDPRDDDEPTVSGRRGC